MDYDVSDELRDLLERATHCRNQPVQDMDAYIEDMAKKLADIPSDLEALTHIG